MKIKKNQANLRNKAVIMINLCEIISFSKSLPKCCLLGTMYEHCNFMVGQI